MKNDKEIEKLKRFSDYPSFALFEELRELNDNIEDLKEEEVKKGDKGDKGDQGEPGKDGLNGRDGKNGIDGKNGLNGKDGIDGLDGIDGEDGKDGSPDTALQIKEKLLSLSEEDRLKLKDLGGFDELILQLEKRGVNRTTIVPQSGITTTFFSLNGEVKGRAKNINFVDGSALDVFLQGDTAIVTIPTGSGSGDFDGRVDFNGNRMTDADLTARGTIPLNTLKFEASSNLLTTVSFLPGLTELRRIEIGNNLLTGFAEDLTALTNLISLDVSQSSLLTSFSADLTGLTNLETLAVNNSALTTFTTDTSTLSGLQYLFLQQNQLTTFTSDLSSSASIISIDISTNPGLTTFAPVLTAGSTLTNLYAGDCAITAMTVPLDTFPNLIDVNFSNNAITTASEIDQIIIDVNTSASINGTMNGNLNLDGGTNAIPTGASAVALANLTVTLAWNVTTN